MRDESWIDNVFNNVEEMYDGGEIPRPPDNANRFSVRKLLHTKWIDEDADHIQINKEPPDKSNIKTKYKLMINAMKATRTNEHRPSTPPQSWDFDGCNWKQLDNGNWDITAEPYHPESRLLNSCESYAEYAKQTDTVFHIANMFHSRTNYFLIKYH